MALTAESLIIIFFSLINKNSNGIITLRNKDSSPVD